MKCTWHLCDNELSGRQTKFCSRSCKLKYFTTKNRKETKKRAAEYKGGKCERCGYYKCLRALTFHHRDGKDFGIAAKGHTRSWERVKKELDKCDLLCHNCHMELHDEEENIPG